MKILCVDVGTGTQDILVFDTTTEVENCLQLVMPSPTVLVARQIRDATARAEPIFLTGTIMGSRYVETAFRTTARCALHPDRDDV